MPYQYTWRQGCSQDLRPEYQASMAQAHLHGDIGGTFVEWRKCGCRGSAGKWGREWQQEQGVAHGYTALETRAVVGKTGREGKSHSTCQPVPATHARFISRTLGGTATTPQGHVNRTIDETSLGTVSFL